MNVERGRPRRPERWASRLGVVLAVAVWVGSIGIFLLAAGELGFGWRFGAEHGVREMPRSATLPVPAVMGPVLRWVAPGCLAIAFVVLALQGLTEALAKVQSRPIAAVTLLGVGGLLATLVFAGRRAMFERFEGRTRR